MRFLVLAVLFVAVLAFGCVDLRQGVVTGKYVDDRAARFPYIIEIEDDNYEDTFAIRNVGAGYDFYLAIKIGDYCQYDGAAEFSWRCYAPSGEERTYANGHS